MSTWILVLLRAIGLFFLTLILVRILTKSYSVRITPFRIINYAVIAILVSLVSVNAIANWVFGIITLAVWILLPIILDYMSVKVRFIYNLVNGKEKVLVKDGKVMEENLTKLGLTGEDLLRELRSKDAFNLADVEFAVMESTGDMNVILKSDKKPITPHDLGIKVSPETPPQTVILDGNVINESLSNLRLNQTWLNEKLENLGVSLDNVFVGQVDCNGELYVDVFDDSVELPEASVKELLYASLEKSQADLTTFSLETENIEAKHMYVREANKLKIVMKKLEPYLLR